MPDQQQQQAEIIHVGNVCQQCGQQWKAFYEDGSILAPIVVEYNEVTVNECEDCEGEGEGESYPARTDGADTS